MKTQKGSVTVFLALSLPLVIVLLFFFIESARYTGLRYAAKAAGNNAMDSLMACYNRTMLDEYGLLFYDGSQGGGFVDFEKIEEEFSSYFEANASSLQAVFGGTLLDVKNVGATVTEVVTATDYNGEIFIRSVLDFYKYDLAGSALDAVKEQLGLMDQADDLKNSTDSDTNRLKTTDWGASNVGKSYSPHSNPYVLSYLAIPDDPLIPGGSDDPGDDLGDDPGDDPGSQEEIVPIDDRELKRELDESAIGEAERSKASGWLSLVMPANSSVSAYRMDQADAPSLSAVDGRRLADNGSLLSDLAKGAGFYEYILSHFSAYDRTLHESGMQYETEYVLFGHASDVQNFEAALNRIMWIREGMNLLYLVTSENREIAMALAEAMVGWTSNQLVVLLTATALMAAWAYAEAILDVRALLQNKRVAFVKTEETWVLSIEGIGNLLSGGGEAAKEDPTGMTYREYLRMLLYLSDESVSAYRTMDLIQDRLRKRSPAFLMASQIYAIEIKADLSADEIFSAQPVTRRIFFHPRRYRWAETFSEVY